MPADPEAGSISSPESWTTSAGGSRMGATFLIANRDGGGGNVARAYLGSKKGDDHVLLCESNRVWLSELMGTDIGGDRGHYPAGAADQ